VTQTYRELPPPTALNAHIACFWMQQVSEEESSKRSELIELLDNLKPGVHAIRDRNRISGYALDLSLTDLAEAAIQARVIGLLEWTVKLITESA
jgi:hypothetical protein